MTASVKSTHMTSNKLTDLEAKRKSTYGAKLTTISEQWRDSQQLLQGGIQETARAERFILGSALVHQARADAMQAIYNDVLLDDELNSVVDEKRQESIYDERIKQGFESLDKSQKAGMLSSLVESQSVVAKQFAEDALLVATHIAKEMTAFREELQSEVNDITTRGKAILEELESAEEQVAATWDAYSSAAAIGGGRRRSWIASSSAGTAEELEKDYGVAVVQQTRVWESNSQKVDDLMDSVITTETGRRAKLQELLRDYVPGQRRLFSTSARIQNKVIEELQQNDDNSRFYPSLELEEHHDRNDFEARELPLTSNLVAAIKIVERKKTKSWERVVSVVTKDNFLHLFEMPKSCSTAISNPEQVFMELLPTNTALFPSDGSSSASDVSENQSTSAASTPATNEFNPLESWFLPNCSIKKTRGSDQREIEITAKAGRFLATRRKKKLLLRTDSMENTSEWIDMLQRKGGEGKSDKSSNPDSDDTEKGKDSGVAEKGKVVFV